MCVICFKPEGAKMPTHDDIRKMFSANPDGSGYMFPADGSVYWRKGFMTPDELTDALEREGDLTGKPVALHFRIATSGRTDEATCHPFPVTRLYDDMRQIAGTAPVAMMHNGIFDTVTPTKTESDTMVFCATIARPMLELARDLDALDSGPAGEVIETLAATSRLLFMDGSGNVVTFGRWYEYGDCLASNLNFAVARQSYFGGFAAGFDGLDDSPVFSVCRWCSNESDCWANGKLCACESDAVETVDFQYMDEWSDDALDQNDTAPADAGNYLCGYHGTD